MPPHAVSFLGKLQGTSADLTKFSTTKVQQVLNSEKCATKIIMDVNHELAFEVLLDEVDSLKEAIPHLIAWVSNLKRRRKPSLAEGRIRTKRTSL